ncbi:TPA: hypothetical protein IUZ48_001370 [Enterococcus faecalis]|uniref:hypothetical protein n=1 Tax=Enterococcus faecalis TaxID=1351 RepID=UPI000E1BCC44|nr:hypothetical protein [Enterococcus faecalis]HAP5242284.1 hypothetical protein [Enterococcus faecalis]HBC8019990.1 hypothetical protein [Enterococcus faecalis]
MDIKLTMLELTIDESVTCKQLADFYDTFHTDKEFTDAVDFLSRSIHVDMAQIKEELRNSEDKGSLGVLEYIQKHYSSAMLFMNLLPQENRRFIH